MGLHEGHGLMSLGPRCRDGGVAVAAAAAAAAVVGRSMTCTPNPSRC